MSEWHGLGAERIGLHGPVQRQEFNALVHNRLPNGEKLTVRDNASRRPGYDFTFSVPKSVSVVAEISGAETVKRIIAQSVHAAMKVVEANVETRDQRNGQDID